MPEFYNYLQAVGIVGLLALMWKRAQGRMFLFWAATFAVVLMDDAFALHEGVGRIAVANGWVVALPGLRAQDSGELLTWFALSLPLLAVLVWAWRAPGPRHRGDARVFVPLLLLLVACAVGVDMLHSLVGRQGWAVVSALMGYLEDGGEMLALGLTLAVTVAVSRRSRERADPGEPRSCLPPHRPAIE